MTISAQPISRLVRLAALIMICLVFALGGATPASAHDKLLTSTPAADTVLKAAPQEISLDFSGEVMDIGNQVRVTDSSGTDVTSGEPTVEGMTVTQNLNIADEMADETYTVTWRVVSADGHPIQGTYSFSVGAGKEASDTQPAASSFATELASPTGETGFTATNIALAAFAGIVALGLVVTVLAKNRKK